MVAGSEVRRLAKAHVVLDHADVALTGRICEAPKKSLSKRALALIRRAAGRPVLQCYSSDATPTATEERYRIASTTDPAAVCERRGRSTLDFIMQVGFIKAKVGGGGTIVVPILRDRRPMSEGKSTWNLFVAMREFCPSLADLHHSGIVVTFTSFDRGCYDSVDLRCRQYFSTAVPIVSGEPQLWGARRAERDEVGALLLHGRRCAIERYAYHSGQPQEQLRLHRHASRRLVAPDRHMRGAARVLGGRVDAGLGVFGRRPEDH